MEDTRTERQQIGDWGEAAAAQFLERKGYQILDRKFRTKHGEIDLVAKNTKDRFGETLCFVEVKTRSYGMGSAERATSKAKQERIFKAAKHYCLEHGIAIDRTPIQFEHVSVYIDPATREPRCELFVIPVD